MLGKILCPYCFERFSRSELEFRCMNTRKCAPELDLAYGRFRGKDAGEFAGRVVASRSFGLFLPSSATCSACGEKTNKPLCPHCHNEPPGTLLDRGADTIGLVGGQGAGKSHYITVLIEELRSRIGSRVGLSCMTLGDETRSRVTAGNAHRLYSEKRTLDPTPPAATDASIHYPFILDLSRERWFRKPRCAALSFFDTAGEDLNALDTMRTEGRYITNSKGLILLVDPLAQQHGYDVRGLVERVVELFGTRGRSSASGKIKTPLAVVFSKFDVIRDLPGLVRGDSVLRCDPAHEGAFDLSDSERVHDELRGLSERWFGGPGFHDTLESQFSRFRYFAVSALGAAPQGEQLPSGIAPFRIADPILWHLHSLGLVPGRRGPRP